MTTKLAKQVRVGDVILLEGGRPARVTATGRGMMRNSVLIDFVHLSGPKSGLQWSCVDRESKVVMAEPEAPKCP